MIVLGCLLERNQVFKEQRKRTCRIGGTKLGNVNDLSLCDYEKQKDKFQDIMFCPFCGNNLYSDVEEKIDVSANPNIFLAPLDLNEDKWVAGIKLAQTNTSHTFNFFETQAKETVEEMLTVYGLWNESKFGLIEFSERDR